MSSRLKLQTSRPSCVLHCVWWMFLKKKKSFFKFSLFIELYFNTTICILIQPSRINKTRMLFWCCFESSLMFDVQYDFYDWAQSQFPHCVLCPSLLIQETRSCCQVRSCLCPPGTWSGSLWARASPSASKVGQPESQSPPASKTKKRALMHQNVCDTSN